MRGVVGIACVVACALTAVPTASSAPGSDPTRTLLSEVAVQYRQAAIAHDAALAAQLRTETALLAEVAPAPATRGLAATVAKTVQQLTPWPLADTVDRLTRLAGARVGRRQDARRYDDVTRSLRAAVAQQRAGQQVAADRAGLTAYAESEPILRALGARSSELGASFWSTDRRAPGVLTALALGLPAARLASAVDRARDRLTLAEQELGDVRVSRATVVSDAAILVFREGLEAVLILAAITASFVGARRHLRRPVLVGALAGLGATALTWLLVQLLISELGTGGLELEAITGLLAVGVLLVVTNWFFHKVYWSQWIARFNRRRRTLERLDRFGFLAGQTVGLGILGLTSVYREGFETVLFVQNLEVSAGVQACLLGAGIGLAATLAVGVATFVVQRKLPYRKMLIATGVLIALVLAVMTGTTVHVLQGLGWLPASGTDFTLPIWANSWLGLYATWEGLAGQLLALLVVLGSYVLAREIQVRGPQRRARDAPDTAAV